MKNANPNNALVHCSPAQTQKLKTMLQRASVIVPATILSAVAHAEGESQQLINGTELAGLIMACLATLAVVTTAFLTVLIGVMGVKMVRKVLAI